MRVVVTSLANEEEFLTYEEVYYITELTYDECIKLGYGLPNNDKNDLFIRLTFDVGKFALFSPEQWNFKIL